MFLASQVFKEHWDEVKKNMSHYQQLFSLWSALQLTLTLSLEEENIQHQGDSASSS